MNIETLGYKYPIKAKLFGNNIALVDAVNRVIFRIDWYSGGYQGRQKLHAVMREIERLFNEDKTFVEPLSTAFAGGSLSEPEPKKEEEHLNGKEETETKTEEQVLTAERVVASKRRGRPKRK